jgi:kinetochore protein Spc25
MSTASYRPHINLAAILATQNPQIDLRLDEYERSTRSFMNLVANYTKKTTTSVIEKTNAYNNEKSRLAEKIQTTKAEINQCKESEIELVEGRGLQGEPFLRAPGL